MYMVPNFTRKKRYTSNIYTIYIIEANISQKGAPLDDILSHTGYVFSICDFNQKILNIELWQIKRRIRIK